MGVKVRLRGHFRGMALAADLENCVKKKVATYLRRADRPQTLEEVAEGVSSTALATDSALSELSHDVVCKDIPTDTDPIRLYWTETERLLSHSQETPTVATSESKQQVTPLRIGLASRKSRMPFKSPARTPNTVPSPTNTPLSRKRLSCRVAKDVDVEQLTNDVQKLNDKLASVEREMAGLVDTYSEDELQLHIDKLHEYNEVKDMGQLLLGKMAEVEGTTTTALYEQFGLGLDD